MSREKEGGGGSKIITSTLQMGIALELHKPSHLGIKDWTGSSKQGRERGRGREREREPPARQPHGGVLGLPKNCGHIHR